MQQLIVSMLSRKAFLCVNTGCCSYLCHNINSTISAKKPVRQYVPEIVTRLLQNHQVEVSTKTDTQRTKNIPHNAQKIQENSPRINTNLHNFETSFQSHVPTELVEVSAQDSQRYLSTD